MRWIEGQKKWAGHFAQAKSGLAADLAAGWGGRTISTPQFGYAVARMARAGLLDYVIRRDEITVMKSAFAMAWRAVKCLKRWVKPSDGPVLIGGVKLGEMRYSKSLLYIRPL